MKILLLYVLICITHSCLGAGHGEDCSVDIPCDGFLECIEGKCGCRPGSIWVDNDCHLLSGSECEPPTGGSEQKCIPNSNCLESTCVCDSADGFVPNVNLQCFLPYDAICEKFISKCDPAGFLTCGASIRCKCEQDPNAYYDPIQKSCFLLTGATCSLGPNTIECTSNSSCLGNTCTCDGDFEPDGSRKCVLPKLQYGARCIRGVRDYCDRSAYLECGDEEICLCANPSNTYFDSNTRMCHVRAESPCSTSGQSCVANSACELHDGNIKCTCNAAKRLKPNRLGQCVLSHDDMCEIGDDLCDTKTRYLLCGTSGVCECRDRLNTIFDSVKDECILLVNSTCAGTGGQQCVENAACDGNTCRCREYFVPNANRKCYLPHGAPCAHSPTHCDSDNFQTCGSDGFCSCQNEDEAYLDTTTGKCYLRSGASCLPISNAQPCTPNSHCDGNLRQCICDGQLTPNPIRKCVLQFGNPCNPELDLCDELGFLECASGATDYRCGCQLSSETRYDTASRTCKLLANAECSLVPEAQKCIQKSACERTPGSIPYQCTCQNSLVPNNERECFLEFDSTCDTVTDLCDPHGFLQCNSRNKCGCRRTDLEYHVESRSCKVTPDGSCSLIGDDEPECVKYSHCDAQGLCKCDTNYESTGEGSCLLKYAAGCNGTMDECNHYKHYNCNNEYTSGRWQCGCEDGFIPTSGVVSPIECLVGYRGNCNNEEFSCNHEAALKCVFGTCSCLSPPDQDYESDNRKCTSLAGKRCNLMADDTDLYNLNCGGNSTCVRNNETDDGVIGICQCDLGYKPNSVLRCANNGVDHVVSILTFPIIMFQIIVYKCFV